jgi:hypothetical protein
MQKRERMPRSDPADFQPDEDLCRGFDLSFGAAEFGVATYSTFINFPDEARIVCIVSKMNFASLRGSCCDQ